MCTFLSGYNKDPFESHCNCIYIFFRTEWSQSNSQSHTVVMLMCSFGLAPLAFDLVSARQTFTSCTAIPHRTVVILITTLKQSQRRMLRKSKFKVKIAPLWWGSLAGDCWISGIRPDGARKSGLLCCWEKLMERSNRQQTRRLAEFVFVGQFNTSSLLTVVSKH